MVKARRLSRRRFLSELAYGGLAASAAVLGGARTAQSLSAPGNPRISPKLLLTPSDFRCLGTFKLPESSGGLTTDWAHALTHRYVNGQLRFFTTTSRVMGSEVYEVVYPGHSLTSPPTAAIARHWGNVYGSKRVDEVGGGGTITFGLFWDEPGQRLYWSYGNGYNASAADNPSIGASTLNDATGVATAVAAWRSDRGCKMTQQGITSIPGWFAAQYTGGRRLGIGFGGRASAQSVGPSSDGLALAAIDPPTGAHLSTIPSTALCGYPAGSLYWSRRPGDYVDQIHSPARGPTPTGAWQWMDFIYQTGVWIDTPSKHGVLFMPHLGHGAIWYESSDIHCERTKHWWAVVDPMDLAAVAQGRKNQYDVVPNSWWEVQYPTYSYPRGRQDGEPFQTAMGATFDAATNRLFVVLPWSWESEGGMRPSVAVYQLS